MFNAELVRLRIEMAKLLSRQLSRAKDFKETRGKRLSIPPESEFNAELVRLRIEMAKLLSRQLSRAKDFKETRGKRLSIPPESEITSNRKPGSQRFIETGL